MRERERERERETENPPEGGWGVRLEQTKRKVMGGGNRENRIIF